MLAPGDSPGIGRALVARPILRAPEAPGRIIVPRPRGRSGHPILIPWPIAREVPRLRPGVGVNALIAEHSGDVEPVEVDDPGPLADLDTPEDYRR